MMSRSSRQPTGCRRGLVDPKIASTGGFTLVLAGLKALLEHDIRLNLVPDPGRGLRPLSGWLFQNPNAQAAGGMVVVGGMADAGGAVGVATGAISLGMRIHRIG